MFRPDLEQSRQQAVTNRDRHIMNTMTQEAAAPSRVRLEGNLSPEQQAFLREAEGFLADCITEFTAERQALLGARASVQEKYSQGILPDFSPATESIRSTDWQCMPLPEDLQDRRVEITGPVERKMVINALNAPVRCFMADFEDSLAPGWDAVIQGQINLRDAVNKTIAYDSPDGKQYRLNENPAVLICRVRGLHLDEKHLHVEGVEDPVPGALVDFCLYFFHNHRSLLANESGPYFYLPKLESWEEAAWWSKVFCYAEDRFYLPRGTIKATMLIETLPAVFQMHEMLYALREHAVGLNCGRWDYIFSYIKTLRSQPEKVLPDRQQVGMDQPFLDAYSRLLIKTCHQRGVMAMGGMSAFIPSKDQEENERIFEKVRQDKEREAANGHDGTWVAHPGLSTLVMDIFTTALGDRSNQLDTLREEDAPITAAELLAPCQGSCTEVGMRANIRVALRYITAWLDGNGCVPIYGLMEDAATAEISRASIWQWIRHGTTLDTGAVVTIELFQKFLEEESKVVTEELGDSLHQQTFDKARELLDRLVVSEELAPFLTVPAYALLQ